MSAPGLQGDHRKVFIDVNPQPPLERDVHHLSLDHLKATLGQDALYLKGIAQAHAGVAQRMGAQVRHHLHGVSRRQCFSFSPDGPDGRPLAALPVSVLDIVVDQRVVVNELESNGCRQSRLGPPANRRRREDAQGRPERLAPVVAGGPALRVHPSKVVAQHGEQVRLPLPHSAPKAFLHER